MASFDSISFQSAANFSLDDGRSILLSSLIDSGAKDLRTPARTPLPLHAAPASHGHRLHVHEHHSARARAPPLQVGRVGRSVRRSVGAPGKDRSRPRSPLGEWTAEKEERVAAAAAAAAAKDSSKKTQPRIIASPERSAKGRKEGKALPATRPERLRQTALVPLRHKSHLRDRKREEEEE